MRGAQMLAARELMIDHAATVDDSGDGYARLADGRAQPRAGIAASLTTTPKGTPMNCVRPLRWAFTTPLSSLLVMSRRVGGARHERGGVTSLAPPSPDRGWVGADKCLQWSLSWTCRSRAAAFVDVTSDSE